MYRCPNCAEAGISFWQKVWASTFGRSTTCRGCNGSVGISAAMTYLTTAPIILYVLGFYFIYYRNLTEEQMRDRNTPWILLLAVVVVPTIVGVLMVAFRVWLIPLVRR